MVIDDFLVVQNPKNVFDNFKTAQLPTHFWCRYRN